MQPAPPVLHHLIDLPVVWNGRLPAHAADQSDGLHESSDLRVLNSGCRSRLRWEPLDQRLSYAALRDGRHIAIRDGRMKFGCWLDIASTLVKGGLNAIALRAGAPIAPTPRSRRERTVRTLLDAFRC